MLSPAGSVTRHVPASAVVTMLFTDIVGSTELLDRLGDDAFESIRRTHFRMLHEAVLASGGTEVKNLGDGLMAVFASAIDALGCAVNIQQAVGRHNRRAREESFEVRVGLHVGEPMHDEEDYFGTPVVIAKRLCDLAAPGQILTSRLVVELAGSRGGYEFCELGPLLLKGLELPVATCSVGWRGHSARPVPAALTSLRERAFVGRDAEIEQLSAAWRSAEGGHREVVMIAGEPGIGKTALAVRVADGAAEQGAIALFGRCDEESVVPFQPFVEALGHYIETTPAEELRRQLGPQAADLAVLVPALSRRLPEVAGAVPAGNDTERYRLFEAVSDFLASIAEDAALVIVLDDLHWADRPTLQLLHHVIRRCGHVALLVLATYRDTDLARTHPLAGVLADLRRGELVRRLPLRGLSAEDVIGLVVPAGSPEPQDVSLAELLWSETEGSPLFLREILRHLQETGAIAQVDGGRWIACRRLNQLGIPEGVKEVIGRRLTRMSAQVNDLLTIASVIGREFAVDLLEQLSDVASDAILDALDEASGAGIVAEVGHRPGRYTFTHALVRQALYDELSLTRRVRWHERVGEALQALHTADRTPYLAELAYHFAQAAAGGHASRAIEYCQLAGDAAMVKVAYEEATRHYATAIEVASDADAGEALRAALLLKKGAAQWRTGDRAARASFTEAAALARDPADPATLARAALGYAGASVRPIWVEIAVVNDDAVALLEEALAAVGNADSEPHALLLATLARELYWRPGSRDRRAHLSRDAVAMARRLEDPAALASVLANRCLATMGPDDAEERVDICEEIRALAEKLGDTALVATSQAYCGVAFIELGDAERATMLFDEYSLLVDHLRDPVASLAVGYARASFEEVSGHFELAEKLRAEAFQQGQEVGDRNAVIQFLVGVASSLRRQGRSAEAVGAAAATLGLYPLTAASVHATLASHYADMGDRQHAAEALQQVDPGDPGFLCGDLAWLYTLAVAAEAAAFLGDRPRAEQLYDLLLPYEQRFVTVGHACILGSCATYLGMLATALGRHDTALGHLRRALAAHERTPWPVLIAETQAALAHSLLARGGDDDMPEATALAWEAARSAEDLGMPTLAHRARGLVERAAGRHADDVHAVVAPISRRDRGRSLLTTGARNLVGRLSRDQDDDELVHRFGGPLAQRALFAAMAKSFQPSAAFGFEGEIAFEVTVPDADGNPVAPDWWTVSVSGRKAAVRRERGTGSSATVRTELPDLVRLLSGELHPMRAVIEGRVRIDGDALLAARIPDMFGGLEAYERVRETASEEEMA